MLKPEIFSCSQKSGLSGTHWYYHFEAADALCEKINKLMNILKKEMEESEENYPWLDKNDERKHMTLRNIGQVH